MVSDILATTKTDLCLFLSVSECDAAAGPEHGAPAFRLAEQGYDVWLGNFRGNTYSRAHLSLNPDVDNEYWRFTWDEMARHDLPAMLDYVMEETGKADLSTRSQRLTTCCYASSLMP